MVLLRLLTQLSTVYHTVKMSHFLELVKDLSFTHDEVSSRRNSPRVVGGPR